MYQFGSRTNLRPFVMLEQSVNRVKGQIEGSREQSVMGQGIEMAATGNDNDVEIMFYTIREVSAYHALQGILCRV